MRGARGGTIGRPVIIITAHGDVRSARSAFRAAAVDFLEKPFDHAQLQAAIERALSLEKKRMLSERESRVEAEKLARLTRRERDVLGWVTRGMHAKEIGTRLGISARTVEVHRARMMAKLGVKNIVELVRLALTRAGDDGQREK